MLGLYCDNSATLFGQCWIGVQSAQYFDRQISRQDSLIVNSPLSGGIFAVLKAEQGQANGLISIIQ